MAGYMVSGEILDRVVVAGNNLLRVVKVSGVM